MLTQQWEFVVEVEGVRGWEVVMVVGNVPELGEWNPEGAFLLHRHPSNEKQWSGNVEVPMQVSIQYRYFVCQFLDPYKDSAVQKVMVISKWETFVHPRAVIVAEFRKPYFQPDQFGKYNDKVGEGEGWLMSQTEIRVRIQDIMFWKSRYRDRNCRIKITPVDLRYREIGISFDEEEECSRDGSDMRTPVIPSHTQCLYVNLNSNSNDYNWKEQDRLGCFFRQDDDLIFRTQSVASEFLAFRIDYYMEAMAGNFKDLNPNRGPCTTQENLDLVGVSHLLPDKDFKDCIHNRTISITSLKHQPIGQLSVETFTVKPLPMSTYMGTMQVSYSGYWKKRGALDVGHRGLGSSYTKMNVAKENTIRSLESAASHGADFVEFDVQLSKDKIPVIYHDFHVCVSVKRRLGSMTDLRALVAKESNTDSEHYELPVKDLRLKQLQLLHLNHPSVLETPTRERELVLSDAADNDIDTNPFPTLQQVLERVSEDTGFNIEIKSPLPFTDGSTECENFFERNQYIDSILHIVMNHANKRRIVFSSFDPFMCTMLKLKQNKYPVLFLTQGKSVRYPYFTDKRTVSSQMAVAFAASDGILGVNFQAEELLRDSSAIYAAQENKLVIFVWGDDLDETENREFFKRVGVDGLVYDRIHDRVGEKKNVFLVEKQMKEALLQNSRSNSPDGTPSPSPTSSPTSSDKGLHVPLIQIHNPPSATNGTPPSP